MVQKRIVQFKNKSLYDKFIGFLIKKGKKTAAKSILEQALSVLSKKLKKTKHTIFLKLFLKLNTFVETKRVKIRNRLYFIPFSISFKRRSYLVIKWLLQSVKEDKNRVSTFEKIAKEIFEILTKPKSKTFNFKTINNNQAFANRSNSHFRW